ncbi:MAG: DUF4267 domain-containing protein [Hyphomonadaceae bacterium]
MANAFKLVVTVVTLVLLLLIGFLALRGIIDPPAAAANFGVAVDDPAAALYSSVYRSRNLVIAAAGLIFLGLGMWRALAILMTASIALPAFDIWLLASSGIDVALVHPATLVGVTLVAALLWLRLRLAG